MVVPLRVGEDSGRSELDPLVVGAVGLAVERDELFGLVDSF